MMEQMDTTASMAKVGFKLLNAILTEATRRNLKTTPALELGVDPKTLRSWGNLTNLWSPNVASRTKLIEYFGSWPAMEQAVEAAPATKPVLLTPRKRATRGKSHNPASDPDSVPITTRLIPFFDLAIIPAARYSETNPLTARDADRMISIDDDVPADAFAMCIRGECMEPVYHSNDRIVFAPVSEYGGSERFTSGKDYYIEHVDGKATFKRVYREEDGRFRLEPLNPAYKAWYEQPDKILRLSRAIRSNKVL